MENDSTSLARTADPLAEAEARAAAADERAAHLIAKIDQFIAELTAQRRAAPGGDAP